MDTAINFPHLGIHLDNVGKKLVSGVWDRH